jgi:ABC-type transport system involved in cytochrome c biogenesis permease subunit
MAAIIERTTVFCFAASYGVALVLELWHLLAPRPIARLVGLGFGAAGLLAHTFYLLAQPMDLATPASSLLLLAWILAVFYLYGSIHHYRHAWGLFVLPLVLGLVVLAAIVPVSPSSEGAPNSGEQSLLADFAGPRFWGLVHGVLVLLAGVGISVAFVASVMYLVQVRRLRAKSALGHGVKMMSLERLEAMNRKAILWAFPLLTAGLIVGAVLRWHQGNLLVGWESPKIVSALGLWCVFAILLYLRYGAHARGRQVALLTLLAFAIMICALLSPVHPFAHAGGGP